VLFALAALATACRSSPELSVSPPADTADEPAGLVVAGFVAFGDFGGGDHQADVAQAMERWAASHRVDALVTTGDNVYERGDPAQFTEQLDVPYQGLRRNRPLWVTLGNHDVSGGHGPSQLAYLGLPALPYAKKLPGVDLLFLDANRPDAAQAAWLQEQLEAAISPFQVVVFHQPAYSCSKHDSDTRVQRQWVPVLDGFGAELVLTGHDHTYQRFEASAGTAYVVTGAGGKSLYGIDQRCDLAAGRLAAASRYHFVAVEVRADSLTISAVDVDGQVFDRAVLTPRLTPAQPLPTTGA